MDPIVVYIGLVLGLDCLVLAIRFRCIPLDNLMIATMIIWILGSWQDNDYYILWFWWGMIQASLSRFLYGWVFHHIPIDKWSQLHESYHQEILRRRLCACYYYADHFIEGVFFSVGLFLDMSFFPSPLALGVAFERYIGQGLRLEVRYDKGSTDTSSLFIQNAKAYYYYHLEQDPNACLGFSAPFWDTLFGTNPFVDKTLPLYRQLWTSTPLPFVDFLFHHYTIPENH
jgi:hypothetical protein